MMTTTKLKALQGDSSTPKSAITAILILVAGVIVLAILIGVRRASESAQNSTYNVVQAAVEVTPGQDMTISSQAVTIYIPKDALNSNGNIIVIHRDPEMYTDADAEGWRRPLVVEVDLQNSDGTLNPDVKFAYPVQICFKVTEDQWWDFNQHPSEYQVQTAEEDGNPPAWLPLLLAVNPYQTEVCGTTSHLSLFALAVWKQNLLPVTGSSSSTPTPFSLLDFLGIGGADQPTPTATAPSTPHPTSTPLPTSTSIPPTANSDPTSTSVPPTSTSAPTSTSVPPTFTSAPTSTPIPTSTPLPTATIRPTSIFPSKTPLPTSTPYPTKTPYVPPTDTPVPDTPVPDTPVPDTPVPDTPVPDTPVVP